MKTKSLLEKLFEDKKPHEIAIIISGFTNCRTTLLEELTEGETTKLLTIYGQKPTDKIEEIRKWRSYILTIATEEGIKEPTSFNKFNHWMKNTSKFKKELHKLNLQELQTVHRQLLAVRRNNTASAEKFGTKAYWRKGVQNIEQN